MTKISCKQFFVLFLAVSSLFLVAGCAKTEYKPVALNSFVSQSQEQNNVEVFTKTLSNAECAKCFDCQEITKKYKSILISINNKSAQPLILASNHLSIPIASKSAIAKKMYRDVDSLIYLAMFSNSYVSIRESIKAAEANVRIDYDLAEKVLGLDESVTILPRQTIKKIIFFDSGEDAQDLVFTLFTEQNKPEVTFTTPI